MEALVVLPACTVGVLLSRAGRDPLDVARPRRWPRLLRYVIGLLVCTVTLGWLGLRVEPSPFDTPNLAEGEVAFVPLPADLPAPVERFYRALYGDSVPIVDTVVISGRGTMRISGVTLPARFRFSHLTGGAYRHHIQTTIYGRTLLAVDERFLDGKGRLELPFGISEGPRIDQGANLALWAEAVWMPSVWVTDDRVRWEAIDETSARLLVPFGEEVEVFTVTFDADTGLLQRMESLRFKGEADTTKTLWINEVGEWGELDGHPVPLVTSIEWGDEGSPWAVLRTEALNRNADLTTYIRHVGP